MSYVITDKECQRESRISNARMLITQLVMDKCGELTEAEYVQVLIGLANDTNRRILKGEIEDIDFSDKPTEGNN